MLETQRIPKIPLRRPSQLLPSFKPPDQTMNQPTEVSIADELSKLAKLAFLPYSSFPSIIGLTGTCSFLPFSLENISADVDVSGSSSFISIPISFLIASFPSLAPIPFFQKMLDSFTTCSFSKQNNMQNNHHGTYFGIGNQ